MDTTKKTELILPTKGLNSRLRLLAVVFIEASLDRVIGLAKKWKRHVTLPLTIEKQNVIGIPSGVVFQGRVLASKTIRQPNVGDSAWANLTGMLQYWMTDEEPYAKVEAVCGGIVKEIQADEEGYFELVFDHAAARGATMIKIRLPHCAPEEWQEVPVPVTALNDLGNLIVCDIDDTVLETNVESVFKLFKTMFLGNVLTRKVFPGMADFFQKVAKEGNLVFFVTSAPWNLRSFIQSVFERHQIPLGGIFMTDWGLDTEKWLCKTHDVHKTEAIEQILEWYPANKVVLIGDSGQRDPEIYVQVATKSPDRISMILIRNVSQANRRGKSVKAFAEKACNQGINFHLFENSAELVEKLTKEQKMFN